MTTSPASAQTIARHRRRCHDRRPHRHGRRGRRRGDRRPGPRRRRRRHRSPAAARSPSAASSPTSARRNRPPTAPRSSTSTPPASRPPGCSTALQRLADQMLISSRSANPYLQSHPLPRERVRRPREPGRARAPTSTARIRPSCRLRHDLVRAKLVGFTWPPERVNRRYPLKRPEPAGALRPRHRRLPPRRPAPGAEADRRPDPGRPRQPLFLGAQGPGAPRDGQGQANGRPAPQGRLARAARPASSASCSARRWSRPAARPSSTRRSPISPSAFRRTPIRRSATARSPAPMP